MTTPPTIAVTYASVGSGHRVAAEAIAAELRGRDGAVRVELIDVLDHATPKISGNLLTSTFSGATAGVYDAAWGSPAFGAFTRAIGRPLSAWWFGGFYRALAVTAPDVVVCTHAAASVMAAREIHRGNARYRLVNVATDFGIHGVWPVADVSLFCVADEQSAESVRSRGLAEDLIAITGLPVRPQFALEYERGAALQHFDLPADRRILLALAGSMMPGPYERFKEALAVSLPALASLPNTAVALVTGRDESFAEEMRSRAAGFGATNVHVFGFVEHMAALMTCADLAVAKPGGGVCAECLAMGVPLALIGPAAGQESANAKALTDAGVAVFSSDPRLVAESVRKVLSKPARLKAMRAAAESLARPFSTADIVHRVLALAPSSVEAGKR